MLRNQINAFSIVQHPTAIAMAMEKAKSKKKKRKKPIILSTTTIIIIYKIQ